MATMPCMLSSRFEKALIIPLGNEEGEEGEEAVVEFSYYILYYAKTYFAMNKYHCV